MRLERMQALPCFSHHGRDARRVGRPELFPRPCGSAQYPDLLVRACRSPNPHDIDSLLGLVQDSLGANAQAAFRAAVKRFGDQWIKRQSPERHHNAILNRRAEPPR